MRRIPLAFVALLLPPIAAHADCPAGIATAMRRANALPSSSGRAALLEQIQRAEVAHHEGDEEDCVEQLKAATDVLDRIDDAKSHSTKEAHPSGASKP